MIPPPSAPLPLTAEYQRLTQRLFDGLAMYRSLVHDLLSLEEAMGCQPLSDSAYWGAALHEILIDHVQSPVWH